MLIKSNDPLLATLRFQDFYSSVERRVEQFLPDLQDPQSIQLTTSWGAVLTAQRGDYVVSSMDNPSDRWPVEREIFEKSYIMTRPGYCMKKAITQLVPLVDLTNGDPDEIVMVETLEGTLTVRAGDFYLARGIKGEIWPYPKAAQLNLIPVDPAPPDLAKKLFG